MTVDQYAICPCGNGKKIKFCKCKESLPELDRVMTMIEGRQIVPAIDKLNQVLTEHPDAAWAMAIKGRLMLDLREYDSLSENSERFVRLQPSNPLALAQRSASELFHNHPEKATLSLLEALTESGRSVDSFVLDIASILAYSLASAGLYLTARAYVQLPLTAQGYESNQTAVMVYQELNTSSEINHLLKTVPPPLPRDEDTPWGERFDEAVGLLRSNQILLAESKLQSLARSIPREPCILTGLLTCAVWRGDGEAQANCLRKLSECEQLDSHSRSKYLALGWLVEPSKSMVTAPTLALEADLTNVEESTMALDASSRFMRLEDELLAQFRDEADVPPRAGFQIIDRDAPAGDQVPNADAFPLALGIVLIHGRQTDRPARIEVLEVRPAYRADVDPLLQAALGDLAWREVASRAMPLLEAIQPPLAFLGAAATDRKSLVKVQREIVVNEFPERLASLPLPCFGGRTLREAVSDSSTLLARTALVRLLENYESLEDHNDVIMSAVRELAGVSALSHLTPSSMGEIEEIDAADLSRIDVANLDATSLLFVFQRARILDCGKLLRRAANRIIEIDLDEKSKGAKVTAYTALIEFASSTEEASELLEKAKTYASANQIDQANLRLLELTHRLMNGDQAGFNATLRSISEQYGKRPEVMARVQQLLMSVGILRPDGSVRERPGASPALGGDGGGAPAASGSALWTPGSGSQSTAPAAASSSKLWIPGMD